MRHGPREVEHLGSAHIVPGRERFCIRLHAAIGAVTVEGKGRIENAGNNEVTATSWLSRPVNWIWRLFFEMYRGDWNVTFEGNILTMGCGAATVRDAYEQVVYHAMPKATRDYSDERRRWSGWFICDWTSEPDASGSSRLLKRHWSYKEEHRRRVVYAREKNCSLSAVMGNFQRAYCEALANKFTYVWGLMLDADS
jgi:hypothetical protein